MCDIICSWTTARQEEVKPSAFVGWLHHPRRRNGAEFSEQISSNAAKRKISLTRNKFTGIFRYSPSSETGGGNSSAESKIKLSRWALTLHWVNRVVYSSPSKIPNTWLAYKVCIRSKNPDSKHLSTSIEQIFSSLHPALRAYANFHQNLFVMNFHQK